MELSYLYIILVAAISAYYYYRFAIRKDRFVNGEFPKWQRIFFALMMLFIHVLMSMIGDNVLFILLGVLWAVIIYNTKSGLRIQKGNCE